MSAMYGDSVDETPRFGSSSFPDINASGSRLLSMESPSFNGDTHSRTGHGGDDLSLGELSLQPLDMGKPFSLLAKIHQKRPEPDPLTPTRDNSIYEEEEHSDEDEQTTNQTSREARDVKLESDVFILKKLNASFEMFYDALRETGSANERVAAQIEQTDALLNYYIDILSKSEDYTSMIFDEKWEGAEADKQALREEILAAKQREKRELEERQKAAQEEKERLEREQVAQLQRDERERIEREKKEKTARGGIKGVRGTRASTRGGRGVAPSRGDPVPASLLPSRGVHKRPPSAMASTRGSGIPRSSYRPT